MKRFTLVRHAKSSWKNPEVTDLQRPLNERGRRAASMMGTICAERLPAPDIVVLSPSVRTRQTVQIFLEAWKAADEKAGQAEVFVLEELYLAGRSEWIRLVGDLAAREGHVVGCGHQPGIEDFASWLDLNFAGEVPTATVISFTTPDGVFPARKDSCTMDFVGRPREFV